MKVIKKSLCAAITLSLILGLGSTAMAAEVDADGRCSTTDETVYVNGAPFATLHYFESGTMNFTGIGEAKLCTIDAATYGNAIRGAISYWSQVIGLPKAGVPDINIYLLDFNQMNAYAFSGPDGRDGNTDTKLANYFLRDSYSGEKPIAEIGVFQNGDNWDFGDLAILSQTAQVNLQGVIIHEMFHALGVSSNKSVDIPISYLDQFIKFSPGITPTTFDKHLRDIYNHTLVDCPYLYCIDTIQPERYSNVFYIRTNSNDLSEARYGGVHFTGDNVASVLAGAQLAWPDDQDGHLGRVAGIPVNGLQIDRKTGYFTPELSHFELQNSLQSHQTYRNWGVPMEVELAAMQDLGYDIDLKKFFGRSIYNDDLNIDNAVGYNEDQAYGVGLHVYGIGNTVRQTADINASGDYAMGIRVDGAGYTNAVSELSPTLKEQGNDITVAEGTTVSAGGYNSRAIDFAYGKNHKLTVNGTVAATGAGGRALCFDFGNSILGNAKEYRGSYLRTQSEKACALLAALEGPLVNTVNINGTVEGNKAAIFISDNALVKNINVNTGAAITGDIISDWQNSDVVGLQLPDGEDGMTSLNFGDASDFSMNYSGNISNSAGDAASTINMYVNNGTLNYSGTAKVNSVTVADGAVMSIGTAGALNTNRISGDTVKVNGTIGALTPGSSDTTLHAENCNLQLQDNSTVQFTGKVTQGSNKQLTGTIVIDNSKLTQGSNLGLAIDAQGIYRPGSYSLVKDGADNDVQLNMSEASVKVSALLAAAYNQAAKKVIISAKDNDGIFAGNEGEAFTALTGDMSADSSRYAKLSAAENDAVTSFLNTDSTNPTQLARARRAMQELTSNSNAQLLQTVQSSTLTSRMIGGRLASVNAKTITVPVSIAPAHFVDEADEGAKGKKAEDKKKGAMTIDVPVTVEPVNSIWAKLDKSWGNAGAANSHTAAITLGYDKKYDAYNRAGVMFSFAGSGIAAANQQDRMQDYRLGFYNGYHQGAHDFMVYADFGVQHHDIKGSTILKPSYATDYHSKVLEIGCEYKYDLHAGDGKIFHVSPYAGLQLSRLWQDGYDEGVLAKKVNAYQGNYAATELGFEVSRYLPKGSYSARLGFKEVWDGAATSLTYNIGSTRLTANSRLDKHFVTAALLGVAKLEHGWSLEGAARLAKGAHDKDYGVSATLKFEW